MATLTVDETKAEAKAKVMDAIDEAKRAIVRRQRQFEDLRDTASYRIKQAPLMSVALGVGAGLFLGAIVGMIAGKAAAKNQTPGCC
jgi:ElaB/YqjD/DUF883 family membrane-anchored ribosome-binding protein